MYNFLCLLRVYFMSMICCLLCLCLLSFFPCLPFCDLPLCHFHLQVCLEGQISRQSAMKSLSEGHQPFGDQIPWKFCEQFRDIVFPSLSGARIVRIATHPSAMRVIFIMAVFLIILCYQFLPMCFSLIL